jgi:hypothetical protein
VRTIAADPKHLGAEIGLIAVLHTWGQTLLSLGVEFSLKVGVRPSGRTVFMLLN